MRFFVGLRNAVLPSLAVWAGIVWAVFRVIYH